MIFTDNPNPHYTYTDFLKEKSDLTEALEPSNESVGSATTIVEAYSHGPKSLDELALEKISLINNKKNQIVTILTNNFNQPGGCGIGTTTSVITGNILNVVVAGTASTFTYGVNSLGVKAEVREDTLYSWTFSALENVNISVTFYEDTGSYQQVTSSSLGIGKTDILINDVSSLQSIHSTSPLIGYYYPIVGSSPTCISIASSISTLISEIVSIRSDINDLIVGINTLKDRKTEKQLDLLYASVSLNDVQRRLTDINNSISVMETYEGTIDSYTS